jgi:protein TonB
LLLSAALALILHGLLFTWKAEWLNKKPHYVGTPRPVTVMMAYKKPPAPKPAQPELSLKPEPPKKPVKKDPPKKVRESKPIPKKEPPPKPKKKPRSKPETQPKAPSVKKKKDILPPAPPPPPPPEPAPAKPSEPAPAKPPEPEFYPEERSKESSQPEADSASASLADEPAFPASLPEGDEKAPEPPDLPVIEAIPHYKKNPPPVYPRMARRRGYEGTVLMEVLVSRKGRVEMVRLLESSGYDVLDREAVAAVKQWVFEPARQGEEKVDMWVKVPVRFNLR